MSVRKLFNHSNCNQEISNNKFSITGQQFDKNLFPKKVSASSLSPLKFQFTDRVQKDKFGYYTNSNSCQNNKADLLKRIYSFSPNNQSSKKYYCKEKKPPKDKEIWSQQYSRRLTEKAKKIHHQNIKRASFTKKDLNQILERISFSKQHSTESYQKLKGKREEKTIDEGPVEEVINEVKLPMTLRKFNHDEVKKSPPKQSNKTVKIISFDGIQNNNNKMNNAGPLQLPSIKNINDTSEIANNSSKCLPYVTADSNKSKSSSKGNSKYQKNELSKIMSDSKLHTLKEEEDNKFPKTNKLINELPDLHASKTLEPKEFSALTKFKRNLTIKQLLEQDRKIQNTLEEIINVQDEKLKKKQKHVRFNLQTEEIQEKD